MRNRTRASAEARVWRARASRASDDASASVRVRTAVTGDDANECHVSSSMRGGQQVITDGAVSYSYLNLRWAD